MPGSAGETEFSGYNFILWLGKGGSHIVWCLYVFMLYIHGLQTSLFGAEATWEDWGPNSEDHPCAPYIALDHEVLFQSSTILAMLVENPTALRCSKVTTSESGARNFGCIQSHHSRLFDRLPILFMSPFLPMYIYLFLFFLVYICSLLGAFSEHSVKSSTAGRSELAVWAGILLKG